jgi:hypothetical protein
MKKDLSFGFAVFILLLLAVVAIAPVSAVTVGSSAGQTIISTPVATTTVVKPFVSATISSTTPTVGDMVTISGKTTGSNVTSGVQIWIFAGNYVNVSTVPVSADGSYSKTASTAGLPPAMYYVFVQDPGPDGILDLDLQEAGLYSGQVVDSLTGALVFNFTGIGSVHDAVAAQTLSGAIVRQGSDDAYTKLTFQLMAPAGSTASPVSTTPASSAPVTTSAAQSPVPVPTTKSPLPLWISLIGLVIGCVCAAQFMRKA